MLAHHSNQLIGGLVAGAAYFLDCFNAGGGLHEQSVEQTLRTRGHAPEVSLQILLQSNFQGNDVGQGTYRQCRRLLYSNQKILNPDIL